MTTEEMVSVEKFRINQAQITAMTINELLSKINELGELHSGTQMANGTYVNRWF